MNELATIQNQSQGLISYNKEQVQLIKNTFAKGATDSELQLMMHMSNKYGLDILTKQIWCVKFGTSPAQIYAGRDGFLEVSHRSGFFDGMDSGTTGSIADKDLKGWCKVFRKDMAHPFSVEVDFLEYTTGKNLWQTKPKTMIQKVAESQCLRKAFSISGLYSPEEMGTQGEIINNPTYEVEEITEVEEIINNPLSKDKVEAIKERAKVKGINQKSICKAYDLDTFDQMSIVQWAEAMDKLGLRPDKKANVLEGVI